MFEDLHYCRGYAYKRIFILKAISKCSNVRYKVRYVNFTSFVKDHGTIFSKERMFYFAVIFSFFVGSYVYYFSNPETSEG